MAGRAVVVVVVAVGAVVVGAVVVGAVVIGAVVVGGVYWVAVGVVGTFSSHAIPSLSASKPFGSLGSALKVACASA